MAKMKSDITIGYRAMSEVRRLFGSMTQAAKVIGCKKRLIYDWGSGTAPSAIYLVRLHEIGADVLWILTGKENKKC